MSKVAYAPMSGDASQDLSAKGWLPLAMRDAALFHGLLCGTALYMDFLTGAESVEKLKHMKEAVRLLNTRLRAPVPELSDGTVVTVAHLADFEVSRPIGLAMGL